MRSKFLSLQLLAAAFIDAVAAGVPTSTATADFLPVTQIKATGGATIKDKNLKADSKINVRHPIQSANAGKGNALRTVKKVVSELLSHDHDPSHSSKSESKDSSKLNHSKVVKVKKVTNFHSKEANDSDKDLSKEFSNSNTNTTSKPESATVSVTPTNLAQTGTHQNHNDKFSKSESQKYMNIRINGKPLPSISSLFGHGLLHNFISLLMRSKHVKKNWVASSESESVPNSNNNIIVHEVQSKLKGLNLLQNQAQNQNLPDLVAEPLDETSDFPESAKSAATAAAAAAAAHESAQTLNDSTSEKSPQKSQAVLSTSSGGHSDPLISRDPSGSLAPSGKDYTLPEPEETIVFTSNNATAVKTDSESNSEPNLLTRGGGHGPGIGSFHHFNLNLKSISFSSLSMDFEYSLLRYLEPWISSLGRILPDNLPGSASEDSANINSDGEIRFIVFVSLFYIGALSIMTLFYSTSVQNIENSDHTFLPRDGFSDELYDMCTQPNISLGSICCPFARWSDSVSKLGFIDFYTAMALWILGGLIDLLWFFPVGLGLIMLVGLYHRIQIRKVYKLPNSVVGDIFAWLFCCPCAIAQEARQVERDAYIASIVAGPPARNVALNTQREVRRLNQQAQQMQQGGGGGMNMNNMRTGGPGSVGNNVYTGQITNPSQSFSESNFSGRTIPQSPAQTNNSGRGRRHH